MPRVKTGTKRRKRHKKILKMAKSYWGGRGRLYARARETVFRALNYAYRDRKARKRDFRRLWILRINAAVRENGLSYSRFIYGLKLAGIELNRKVLADMAIKDKESFSRLVEVARQQLAV